MDFKTLTPQEIQTLQVDAALRLVGEYSSQLPLINTQISEAIVQKYQAESNLQKLKNNKKTMIEMLRALKVIVNNA